MNDPAAEAVARLEFSESDNRVIGDLGSKLSQLGVLIAVVAAVIVAFAGFGLVRASNAGGDIFRYIEPGTVLLEALLLLALGRWATNAGKSFNAVATTRGSDMTNLMVALSNLHRTVCVFYWIAVLFLLLIIIGLVAPMIMSALEAARVQP